MKTKIKSLAGLLSVTLLIGMLFVPFPFNVTAEDAPLKSFTADFSDATVYGGGRAASHSSPSSSVSEPVGVTENQAGGNMENMIILGGSTASPKYPKWYFYQDNYNAAGLGVDKQVLVTTAFIGNGVPGMFDYGWGYSGSGGTFQPISDTYSRGTMITPNALNTSNYPVTSISGTARLATPIYNAAVTYAGKTYSIGDSVLDNYAGTTFIVSKSSEKATVNNYNGSGTYEGQIYQLVTVNLGISEGKLVFSAGESAVVGLTPSATSGNYYYANVSNFGLYQNKKYSALAVNSLVSTSDEDPLINYVVHKDGSALSDDEKKAVSDYLESITKLENSLSKFTVAKNETSNFTISCTEEDYSEILDDYKVDYTLTSGSGKYEIRLGLNINGYDDYCAEHENMPANGIALKFGNDYFNNTSFTDIAIPDTGTIKLTTDTAMFGIGTVVQPCWPNDTTATPVNVAVAQASTAIADMTVNYDVSSWYSEQANNFKTAAENIASDREYYLPSDLEAINGALALYSTEYTDKYTDDIVALYEKLSAAKKALDGGDAYYGNEEAYLDDCGFDALIKDKITVNAYGASVLKYAQLGEGQNLRFGFDFSNLKSYLSENDDLTLKDYGVYAHVNTCTKDELLSKEGNKTSLMEYDLKDTVTVVFKRSEEYAQARISVMAYLTVEYRGKEYTIYSDNDSDSPKIDDGVATKSVMGIMKAELLDQVEASKYDTALAEKINAAVAEANSKLDTSFDTDVLEKTSTDENRDFIKNLFYYFFNSNSN